MTDVQKIAFDTLKAGAPGLSDQTREVLAGIIARKVALSTTPARAEAQDEGAAGEASAYRVRMISNDPVEWVLMHPEKALDFMSRKGWESQPLYAHPSPTPAADADRLREAMRELIDADKELAEAINFAEPTENNDALTTAEYRARAARNQAEQALAALKSTAAKEGGAHDRL